MVLDIFYWHETKLKKEKKRRTNAMEGKPRASTLLKKKKKRTKKDIKDAISILLWHVKKQLLNNSP